MGSAPEGAVLAREVEAQDVGVNERLLRSLAYVTGGLYGPDARFVPPPKHPGRAEPIALWPPLLWLAIAFMLVELALRKLGGKANALGIGEAWRRCSARCITFACNRVSEY